MRNKDRNKRKIKKEQNDQKKEKCSHCHKKNHVSKDCHFKDATCFECKSECHIAPACPRKHKTVHQLENSENDDNCLYSLKNDKNTD